MRKRSLLCLSLLSTLVIGFAATAYASPEQELAQCSSSDAVCVGRVLLKAMKAGNGKPGGGAWGPQTVEFFGASYSDNRCSSNAKIGTITFSAGNSESNERQCREIPQKFGTSVAVMTVYSVRINDGDCMKIAEQPFNQACLAFQ